MGKNIEDVPIHQLARDMITESDNEDIDDNDNIDNDKDQEPGSAAAAAVDTPSYIHSSSLYPPVTTQSTNAANTSDRTKTKLSTAKHTHLEHVFFMNGITVHRASQLTGIREETVKKYFKRWSDALIAEQDETWAERQKRVRARALEGLAMKLTECRERRNTLYNVYQQLLFTKTGITINSPTGKKVKKTKNTMLKLRHLSDIEHDLVLNYEAKLQTLDKHLLDIDTEYNAMDCKPPNETVLQAELTLMINALQDDILLGTKDGFNGIVAQGVGAGTTNPVAKKKDCSGNSKDVTVTGAGLKDTPTALTHRSRLTQILNEDH